MLLLLWLILALLTGCRSPRLAVDFRPTTSTRTASAAPTPQPPAAPDSVVTPNCRSHRQRATRAGAPAPRPVTALLGSTGLTPTAARHYAPHQQRLALRPPLLKQAQKQQPTDYNPFAGLGKVLLLGLGSILALLGLALLVQALLDLTFLAALGVVVAGVLGLIYAGIIVGSYVHR